MNPIVIAALVVAAIGAVCAVMLVLASKFFAVKEDETFQKIRECLPGANCGACGYAGCDGYAKALCEEQGIKTNLCIPGADATSKQIAELLGVEFEDVVEQVAVIHCYGDCHHTSVKMDYVGIQSCEAAKLMYGGAGKCVYGCMGLGDCARVCPQGAICIENGIAHVDTRKCVGCGLCAKACPRNLIEIIEDTKRVLVTCSNKEKGAVAKRKCSNACIGCKICEKNCPVGAIKVTDNLAHIDYTLCENCDTCAKNCPVGCIFIADFSGLHRHKESPWEQEKAKAEKALAQHAQKKNNA
ncbi:MAG: RnfABCDGE type electron transport complex subunit B [Ruminococcaceae bacterium]|nr:RnfABCDGE type electron transport complex subunit B [Oscillospiraceae bacterium]